MRLKTSEVNEMKKKHLEERIGSITDEDITLGAAWDRQQNFESSEKLLEALIREHGNKLRGETKC